MKKTVIILFTVLAGMLASDAVMAQDNKKGVEIGGGADLVSSYVWRGFYNAGASIQPSLAMKAGGFSLTAWGSVDFAATDYKEIDLTAAYSVAGFTFSLTDYYWTGTAGEHNAVASRKYFDLGATSPHRIEVGASYNFGEKFPLTVSWYTMLFGAVDRDADGKQSYTSYAELSYPFSVRSVDMSVWCGVTPWSSPSTYGTKGFEVCNIGIGASRTFRLGENFSFPLFVKTYWNPAKDDAFIVGGLSFYL